MSYSESNHGILWLAKCLFRVGSMDKCDVVKVLSSSSSGSRVHTGDIVPQWHKTDCCI